MTEPPDQPPDLQPIRRIAAYGVCRDLHDNVLLVRASQSTGTPGAWSLPGGAVAHGENPRDTVVRETAAETGLSVAVDGLLDVSADLRAMPDRGLAIHTDRLVYGVRQRGGALIDRVGQPTDLCQWMSLAYAAAMPLRPFTAIALGLPPAAVDLQLDQAPDVPSFHAVAGSDGLHRAQRFAAYAVARDDRDRVLLTRVADGYPGAGRWHLPGGGTDFGESPGPALLRELLEETGQHGELVRLLGVASHRDAASLGPEGYPIDWHGVRAFYLVHIAAATEPTVHDVGGSTGEARWFSPTEMGALDPADDLTEVTAEALASLGTPAKRHPKVPRRPRTARTHHAR
jgi:8-oxo-dGTP diphosphatase